jgi:hypothetical protein
VRVTANNQIVTQHVFKATDITELIERYTAIAAPLRDRVIGRTSADLTRENDDSGENTMGNLIADAQLAATSPAGSGAAVAAFMNPGGVRSDLAAGDVTYGAAFPVQPFGNSLVTLTLTGAQLLDVLKQQWCTQDSPRVLLPSAGVHYTYSAAAATALVGQLRGRGQPGRGAHDRRRRSRPGRELPDHGQLVPRRRRRQVHRAARRDRPARRRRGHRRARGLPGAVAYRRPDRAARPRPDRRDRLSAARAAQYPHMPCTPPPGGVDEEHRNTPERGVR